jgi:ATP-dependent protease HslVU (ClpYQ) peptidase subunit
VTTILASMKHRVMVADSRCSGGGSHFRTQKIFRVGDKLIGCCGTTMHAKKFIEWMMHGTPVSFVYDKEDQTFQALVMDGGFLLYYDNELVPITVDEPFFAIGSGSAYAIGAMDAGASPQRAVELAILRDECSGPPIVSIKHKF